MKNEHDKNQIVCLTTFFTILLQKGKIKASHTKINHIFLRNKNASTGWHNYSINLFFSVDKNLVYFWHVMFFLDASHNISQNMRFWKKKRYKKNAKTFFFEEDQMVF